MEKVTISMCLFNKKGNPELAMHTLTEYLKDSLEISYKRAETLARKLREARMLYDAKEDLASINLNITMEQYGRLCCLRVAYGLREYVGNIRLLDIVLEDKPTKPEPIEVRPNYRSLA